MNELRLCEWQYQVRHESVEAFDWQEKVFLKSNPEVPMEVFKWDGDLVEVTWNANGRKVFASFPPQCLLQYKWAALKTNGKYQICLN